jgi:HNH endonuclease
MISEAAPDLGVSCLGGVSLKKVLTASRLRRLLSYDAKTGLFVWRSRPDKGQFNSQFAGSVAGTTQSMGYTQICVEGKKYLAHRLAFLYMRGSFPRGNVDHANHIPNDNRFENLRSASQSQNRANTCRPRNNVSGKKGVYLFRRKWHATIAKDYKQYYLGSFSSIESAAAAYAEKARELFGQYARVE